MPDDQLSRAQCTASNCIRVTWTTIAKDFALRALDEEQQFYELVDLDAPGDNDDEEMERLIGEMTKASMAI